MIEAEDNPQRVIDGNSYDSAVILSACDNKNFYRAGYAKYFLLRLELLASEHDAPLDYSAKSVEHVLPQNPKQGSDWENWNDLQKINEYVNTVGNLVLLSKGKNSSSKNYDFSVKKRKYLNPRVSNYPRSVEVLSEATWGPDIISQRTADVKNRILQDI